MTELPDISVKMAHIKKMKDAEVQCVSQERLYVGRTQVGLKIKSMMQLLQKTEDTPSRKNDKSKDTEKPKCCTVKTGNMEAKQNEHIREVHNGAVSSSLQIPWKLEQESKVMEALKNNEVAQRV